jgi:methyl-accepting chemotaxis protein
MTIIRRTTTAVGGLLVLLLAVVGIGIGLTVWLQSWHSDYVEAAQQTGAATNPTLQALLDTLSSRASVMMIVIVVVAVVALALGITAAVLIIRTTSRQFRVAVTSIGGSAAELLAVASQVAAATAQTAAATNETTATVEEVKQTATLAQEKAAEASELSEEVAERCKYGMESARQNLSMFERIQADMVLVAESIDRLNEQAGSVGDIIATVNDLAEQSNLLSVNASIEAAKAGEQGKGFTVVAQEVKNLAEQSKQAVAQVRSVLSEIQKASAAAVRAVDESRGAVEAGRVESAQGVENTKAEVEVATKAAEAALQISASTQQQLAGMEQINQAILSIREAGTQQVSGTRQVEKEVKQLQDLAAGLNRLVGIVTSTETGASPARAR